MKVLLLLLMGHERNNLIGVFYIQSVRAVSLHNLADRMGRDVNRSSPTPASSFGIDANPCFGPTALH